MATKPKTADPSRKAMHSDLVWAVRNVDDEKADKAAPSPMAKKLRKILHNDDGKFMSMVVKLLPKDAALDKLDKHSPEAAEEHLVKLDKLLDDFNKEQK